MIRRYIATASAPATRMTKGTVSGAAISIAQPTPSPQLPCGGTQPYSRPSAYGSAAAAAQTTTQNVEIAANPATSLGRRGLKPPASRGGRRRGWSRGWGSFSHSPMTGDLGHDPPHAAASMSATARATEPSASMPRVASSTGIVSRPASRVHRGEAGTEVGGEAGIIDRREAALAQVAGEPGLGRAVRLDEGAAGVEIAAVSLADHQLRVRHR